jgi:hypothetical protein
MLTKKKKNKVKHPKACFTIEYHLCHTDDQSILAAIVCFLQFVDNNVDVIKVSQNTNIINY